VEQLKSADNRILQEQLQEKVSPPFVFNFQLKLVTLIKSKKALLITECGNQRFTRKSSSP
jgi:hypothetical protein